MEHAKTCPACGHEIPAGEEALVVGLHVYTHKGTCYESMFAQLVTAGQLELQLQPRQEPRPAAMVCIGNCRICPMCDGG